ncbi:MAG: hypothetical protein C0402_04435 [Thermodesulfovibrio sp.]|nr:hypothetical protein [Thermodesulfovibrio sp.]
MRDLIKDGRIPLVLIIDTDPSVRLRVGQIIENAGLKTIEAACGAKGLQLFQEAGPDLVILDLVMPDVSGLDVCGQIRSMPRGKQVPVLILTGLDDAESIEAAYAAGATDFLTKPINWQLFGHRVRYIMRSGRNLVELKQAGEVLRESEERFRLMFQDHDAIMLLIEPESGRIIDVNLSAESFYGYSAGVMKTMTIQEINSLSPEEIAIERELAKSRKQNHFIFPHRLASGEIRTVEVYSSPIPVRQQQLLFSVIHDITGRIKAEQQLADAHIFNEQILSASPVGIGTYDFEGQCISMNEQGARLIGATPEQALKQNFRSLESWKKSGLLDYAEKTLATGEQTRGVIHITTTYNRSLWLDCLFSTFSARGNRHLLLTFTDMTRYKEAEAKINKLLNEQQIILDTIAVGVGYFVNRNIIWSNKGLNRMFGFAPDELNGENTRVFYPDRESYHRVGQEAYAVVNKGGVFNSEVQMKKKDGSLFWCNIVGQVANREHPEEGSIWMLQDVSEKKAAGQEILKMEKLESVGILAGGIAHDFNNLLQGILGNITIAKLQGVSAEQRLQWLSSAEKACEMAHELTQRLIIFSKGGDPVKSAVPLDALVRDAVTLALTGSPILPEFAFPENSLAVNVDPGQIRQVFRNLTINAKEAMPLGGSLIITAHSVSIVDPERLALPPGSYVEILFRDTGPGIPPEAMGKIFDPYFSTKNRGTEKGMGLGLTISDAIIRKHGGKITVESEAGNGTTFHLYLPMAADTGRGTQSVPV